MAQALGVVAVDLDVPVKGFHPGGTVKGVVAVPGLIVCQQVACMVIAEKGGGTVFGVGRQAVAGVVLVEFLHALGNAFGAVAGFVVGKLCPVVDVRSLIDVGKALATN